MRRRKCLERAALPIFIICLYQSFRIFTLYLPNANWQLDAVRAMTHSLAPPPDKIESKNGDFARIDQLISKLQTCSNLTKPNSHQLLPRRYGVWHVAEVDQKVEIFMYSAFYDDRAANGITPAVRILAVSPRLQDYNLTCQVWLFGHAHPLILPIILRKNGGGHSINHVHYEQYYLTCNLPASLPLPEYVSITSKNCRTPQSLVPVFVPIRSSPEHQFGVCVPIAFNHVDPHRLVEWFEANILLGVTEFNIYHVKMSTESMRVFEYYRAKNLVRLHHVPTVPRFENSRGGVKIASPISLNDCMYRNLYRYRWMVVIDFDDLILPRNGARNLEQLLVAVNKREKLTSPARSYTFRNSYFWVGCPVVDRRAPKWSIMQRHVYRQKPNKFLFSSKSVVDPRLCLSVFNHYCYARFPVAKGERWTIDVSPDLALTHHYRSIQVKKGVSIQQHCQKLMNGTVLDRSLKMHQDALSKNAEEKIKDLNI